jgi:hypothetical protein
MNRPCAWAFVVALWFFQSLSTAAAQGFPVPPPSNFQPMSYTAISNLHSSINAAAMVSRATTGDDAVKESSAQRPERRSDRSRSTVVAAVQPVVGTKRLAATYPEATRKRAEQVFQDLLAGYGQIEQQFGIPRRDLAGAVAAFIAGSVMAYQDIDFPDPDFPPLVNQMRQVLSSNVDVATASPAERQEMYEQLAILGTFMATTRMALQSQPNADMTLKLRQTAKGYLEQFLKVDADKVRITSQGLVIH